METLLLLLCPLMAVAGVLALARALWLLLCWRPAAARVLDSDYPEAEQQSDARTLGWTPFSRRGWRARDVSRMRYIEDRICFEDAAGRRHRVSVGRNVRRGWRPFAAYVVWYDPADPTRATWFGPGYWLFSALAFGAMLAMLLYRCAQIGVTGG